MSFWTKLEGRGCWVGNSQVDEKGQMFGKQILTGLPGNSRAQEEIFAWFTWIFWGGHAGFLGAKVSKLGLPP